MAFFPPKKDSSIKTAAEKQYFTVKVETLVPATFTYKIYTDDPKKAEQLIHQTAPEHIQYHLPKRRFLDMVVYKLMTTLILFKKKLS